MEVENLGYLKLDEVLMLEDFSIYLTQKNTDIVVLNSHYKTLHLYYPKRDRLPWKVVSGKKICSGVKIFDSKENDINDIDTRGWNNGNQIMCYKEFSCW